ncbi:MAG TPA: ATP-binding protein [Verrucomicrobiae bacterium]|jgi:signal transduction histidine kinase|nr:ATP-binding protein [Verrucomicrobiae bacterium]
MQTNGTFDATAGLAGANGKVPAVRLRLVGLCLTALLGSILVLWASRTTWERVESLQREFAGLKADNFYIGVRMRGDIQRLNETLLRYRLRGDTNDAESFRSQAQEFSQWLDQNTNNATAPVEQEFFQRVRRAYDEYVTESVRVLQSSMGWLPWGGAGKFKASYEKVQTQSRVLLQLCDSFVDDQRTSFGDFLKSSQATLTQFQQLLQISLALVLVLAAALVVLVYRGMIAPLRLKLSETQAEVARQEKLASLGVLAAGVAHEIRNPLTAIKFRLFSLKNTLPPALAENEDAAVIASEITRLERIVRDFLKFARPSEPELVAVPVRRMLLEVADLLRPELEKDAIALRLEDSEEAWVSADSQQIKQVLINLIHNSAESIERNGIIVMRLRSESGLGRGESSTVVVEVADNGKGIPPEVKKRLFDPFFTTKEGGTGLGLPIAARIVEKHGGELRYQTELRRGTTFSIVLPRVLKNETENSAH